MTTVLASAPFSGAGSTALKDYAAPVGFGKFSLGGLASGLHVDVTGGVAVVNTSGGFTDGAWNDTDVVHDLFEMYADMMRANDSTTTQFQAIICRSNGLSGTNEDHVDIQWERVDDSTVQLHIKRINQNTVQQDQTVNASFVWAKGTWMRLGCFVQGSKVWLFTEPQGGGARTVHGSLVLSGTGGDFNDTSHMRFGLRCIEKPHQWDNFTVTQLPLAFTVQPSQTVAGVAVSAAPKITLMDTALGTVIDTYAGSVAVAIGTNPGSGTLSGTTPVSAASGVATFSDLSINKSGIGYTLVASASGVDDGTSAGFTIIGAAIASASISTQPPATRPAGLTFTVGVTAFDAFGNVATYSGAVSIAIQTNPAGGTLGGTLTRNAVAGVATFNDLTIDNAGTGYVLRATAA